MPSFRNKIPYSLLKPSKPETVHRGVVFQLLLIRENVKNHNCTLLWDLRALFLIYCTHALNFWNKLCSVLLKQRTVLPRFAFLLYFPGSVFVNLFKRTLTSTVGIPRQ